MKGKGTRNEGGLKKEMKDSEGEMNGNEGM